MAVTNVTYAADASIAVTAWDSLGTDAWATSAAFDNATTNKYVDVLVGGAINSAGTSMVAGETFDIYIAARYDNDLVSYTSGIGTGFAAASAETDDGDFISANLIHLTTVGIDTAAPTTAQAYNWGPIAVAQCFGGHMPQNFILVLHNNTSGSLAASGNVINAVGITYTST